MYIGDIIDKRITIGDTYEDYFNKWNWNPGNTGTSLTINYNSCPLETPLRSFPSIERVLFNDPATIIFWSDGSKTVVKAVNEDFDPEKGLAMAIAKKALGNTGHYYYTIRKWVAEYYLNFTPQTCTTLAEAVEIAKQRMMELAQSLAGKKSMKPEIKWFVECPNNKYKKYPSDAEGMCPCCGKFHAAFHYNENYNPTGDDTD